MHRLNGRIVAVCGDHPVRCDPADLRSEDIDVLVLDRDRLIGSLRRLLALTEPSRAVPSGPLLAVGTVPIRAGLGVPVLLRLPPGDAPIGPHQVPGLHADETPGLILTPTRQLTASVPDGWTHLALADLVGSDDQERLAPLPAVDEWLDRIRGRVARPKGRPTQPIWALPHDARWEQLTLEIIADDPDEPDADRDRLTVQFGRTKRTFEPVDVGMRNLKKRAPNLQWYLLRSFAVFGGRVGRGTVVNEPGASSRSRHGRAADWEQVKKQKQILSKALRQAFGISVDPITWDDIENEYVCRFVIRLVQRRQLHDPLDVDLLR